MAKKKPAKRKTETKQSDGPAIHCAHQRIADPATLIANPRNPNKHGDAQIALLAKIIAHQGWRAPITISKRSGFVVTGHGRLAAAKLLNLASVPVDEQDFANEADEWAHMVADNKIAELAETDYEEMSAIIHELNGNGIDLALLGMEPHDLEVLLAADWKPGDPGDLTGGDDHAKLKSFSATHEQAEIIQRAIAKMRESKADSEMSEGRCLELICAEYLA